MMASAGTTKDRRLARDLELDRAVDPGAQRAVGIGKIDLGQKRARAGLQRVGDPGHLARELAIGEFGHAHDGVDARRHAKGRVLRHVDPDADHVLCMISNMKVPLVALPCTRLPTSTLRWVMTPSNGATTKA